MGATSRNSLSTIKKTGEFAYKSFSKYQKQEHEGKLKKAATAPSSYLDEGYPYDVLSKFPFEKLVDDTVSVTERNVDAKMAFFLFMGIVGLLESFDEQPNEVFYPIAGKIIMSDYVDYMDYDLDGSGEVTYNELFEGTIRATTELLK